jgi:hypothetical protein
LRIRLKAEGSNDKSEDTGTAIGTLDRASTAEGTAVDANSDEGASQPSPALTTESGNSSNDSPSTSKKKDKDYSSTPKSDTKPTKDKQNLIGKINNLVSTDLGNIVDGRDFLIISTLQFCGLSLGLLF